MWQWLSTPPGSTQPAGGVDLGGCPAARPWPIAAMRSPRIADVGLEDGGRGGDGAAADDEIEVGHRQSPRSAPVVAQDGPQLPACRSSEIHVANKATMA